MHWFNSLLRLMTWTIAHSLPVWFKVDGTTECNCMAGWVFQDRRCFAGLDDRKTAAFAHLWTANCCRTENWTCCIAPSIGPSNMAFSCIFSDLKLQVNSDSDRTGCCFWFREAYDNHIELQPLHCLPKQERPALQSGEDSFSFRPPARQESALSGQKRCVDGLAWYWWLVHKQFSGPIWMMIQWQ